MRTKEKMVILITFWVAQVFISAGFAREINFESYYVQDGLSDPNITAIYRDTYGFLWIGTSNGLNRFNGYSFTVFRSKSKNPGDLQEEYIQCISEDYNNNLLVGTWGSGLAVFNRQKESFTHFVSDSTNENSISHDWIRVIYRDKKDRTWIGTQNGLNLYDPEKKSFTRYLTDIHNPENPVELRLTSIYGIDEDNNGNLWIATWSGLIVFNPDLGRIIKIDKNHEFGLISTNRLQSVLVDRNNEVWIGTYKAGLIHLKDIMITGNNIQAVREDFTIKSSGNIQNVISDLRINDLTEDQNNHIWIATEMGLNYINIETHEILNYYHKINDPNSLPSNFINKVYVDKDDILWIGTLDNGLSKYDKSRQKFPITFNEINQSDDPLIKYVKSVYQDSKNRYWIGTDYGLFMYSPEMKLLRTFINDPEDETSIDIGGVTGVCEDAFGQYWVVTWGGGLHKLNEQNWEFERLPRQGNDPFEKRQYDDPFDKKNLGDADVRCFIPDYFGGIWLGTNSGFLDFYDIQKKQFEHYFIFDSDSLRGVPVSSLEISKSGIIWGGSNENGGLIRIDPKTKQITRYFADDKKNSILSNDIYTIAVDRSENLWIGMDKGICKYFPEQDSFINFSENLNLVEQAVYNIEIDHNGDLWLSTHSKLLHYEVKSNNKIEYISQDGVRIKNITGITDNKGNIVLGGMNGLNLLNPEKIPQNKKIPNLVFTEFRVFNEPIDFKTNKDILSNHVNSTDVIRLKHDQSFFSIGFAALNFSQTEKNQYLYKLEGFDKDWVASNTRLANYTNVDPGTYIFKVIGSNNDGIWDREGREIKIIIDPPWYKTWWAYTLYVSLIVFAIIIIVRVSLQREKLKNEFLMQRMEAKKHEELMTKEREVDQLKLKFFTNISHEFRTPLTLILGPADELLNVSSFDKSIIDGLGVIRKNAARLLRLVNQIMDFSKVESGFMRFTIQQGDVAAHISGIVDSFKHKAQKRNISYHFTSTHSSVIGYFDADKIEKILYNLVSNAFKFTPDNGLIEISLKFFKDGRLLPPGDTKPDNFEFKIIDSGIGISKEMQNQVFNRFFQGEKSAVGTGIGLSLASSLTKIHCGKLSVASEEGCGSTFILNLPLSLHLMDKYHIDEQVIPLEEKVSVIDLDDSSRETGSLQPGSDNRMDIIVEAEPNQGEYIILVVEDNPEMQDYIKGILEKDFIVKVADNGEKGLQSAIRYIPDVIISDVMMPGKDGYMLCENIKEHQATSHIPVILLTAKANQEDKLKGFGSGADDYIVKPFNSEELRLKINNIIATRAKYQAFFSNGNKGLENVPTYNSVDDNFLKKIHLVLEKNISESTLDHKVLSEEIGMSRAQLYRKLKALTNMSVHELIRLHRLEKSVELLRDQGLTVSEVMYQVGFKNHSYFTKCFKEKYGVTPTDYQNTLV